MEDSPWDSGTCFVQWSYPQIIMYISQTQLKLHIWRLCYAWYVFSLKTFGGVQNCCESDRFNIRWKLQQNPLIRLFSNIGNRQAVNRTTDKTSGRTNQQADVIKMLHDLTRYYSQCCMWDIPYFTISVVNVRLDCLRLRPANERRRYKVIPSLIGWVKA